MLVWEGTAYAGISILLSLALSLGMSGLLKGVAEGMFWFFTYRFTITPVLCVAPVFLIMGVCIPLVVYRFAAKQSIVERLRQTE
jgi:putative ABC transport system permease protein